MGAKIEAKSLRKEVSMKATCKREGLLEALNLTAPAREKAYGLSAKDGQMVVISGNQAVAMLVSVRATVAAKGQCLLPKEAVAFLKTLSGAQVSLSTGTKKVEVSIPGGWNGGQRVEAHKEMQEQGVLKIACGEDTGSFAVEDPKVATQLVEIEGKVRKGYNPVAITNLGQAIGQVLYAVKPEEKSWASPLMGVGLAPSAKGFDLVGCDQNRLAVTTIKTGCKVEPATIGQAAARILSTWERTRMWQSKGILMFQSGSLVLLTASQGSYPEYRQLVPVTRRAVKVYSAEMRKAVQSGIAVVGGAGTIRLVSRGRKLKVLALAGNASVEPEIASAGRIRQAYQASFLVDLLDHADEIAEIRLAEKSTDAEYEPQAAVVRSNGTIHLLCPRLVNEWAPVKKAAQVPAGKAVGDFARDTQPEDIDEPEDEPEGEDELEAVGVGSDNE